MPEAYQRLKRCEASFRKSYGGDNFERLIAIKGSTGTYTACSKTNCVVIDFSRRPVNDTFLHFGYSELYKCSLFFILLNNVNVIELRILGNEAALIMRLHLLQGIVLFHKNKRSEALEMLRKAEAELKFLKVDEGKLMSLTELGRYPNLKRFFTSIAFRTLTIFCTPC